MLHLIDCVRQSIQQENWHAALSTALMLPDVCAGLELERDTVASDYIEWCDRYVRPIFEAEHNIIIPGVEIYVLRCAYLHKGTGDLRQQKKADILKHYRFVAPLKGLTAAPSQIPGNPRTFQILVDAFCQIICCGAEQWAKSVLTQRDDVKRRSESLLRIFDPRVDGWVITAIEPSLRERGRPQEATAGLNQSEQHAPIEAEGRSRHKINLDKDD